MKKASELEVATPLTLGDMLNHAKVVGDVEIINECNETLLTLGYIENNVCSLNKTLNKELLERPIISFGAQDGLTLFKVEGVEDAE